MCTTTLFSPLVMTCLYCVFRVPQGPRGPLDTVDSKADVYVQNTDFTSL